MATCFIFILLVFVSSLEEDVNSSSPAQKNLAPGICSLGERLHDACWPEQEIRAARIRHVYEEIGSGTSLKAHERRAKGRKGRWSPIAGFGIERSKKEGAMLGIGRILGVNPGVFKLQARYMGSVRYIADSFSRCFLFNRGFEIYCDHSQPHCSIWPSSASSPESILPASSLQARGAEHTSLLSERNDEAKAIEEILQHRVLKSNDLIRQLLLCIRFDTSASTWTGSNIMYLRRDIKIILRSTE